MSKDARTTSSRKARIKRKSLADDPGTSASGDLHSSLTTLPLPRKPRKLDDDARRELSRLTFRPARSGSKELFEIVAPGSGEKVTPLLPYGVGIDTHRDFIQVCVLVQGRDGVERYEQEFQTTWACLKDACNWALHRVQLAEPDCTREALRYVIESTGTYHFPVLLAWGGKPSVINPMLAGSTKRKTDVLDARMLSHHSLVGLWKESFIPSRQAEVLRILVNMRAECGRNATRCINRINNHALRFGHTLGREHSMVDPFARAAIEDMCGGVVPNSELICPDGIPEHARQFFMECYEYYDFWSERKCKYHDLALKYAKQCYWPILEGLISGNDLLKHLQSVTGVGEVSALTWLSVTCDPRRFPNAKSVAAFCGCDPSLKVSAGKVTSHVKRKGNARLHHVLKNVAAQLVRRKSEPIGQWGFALLRRHAKGGWARAINAVSRRLSIFLWQVHCRGEKFDLQKYKFFEVPKVEEVPTEQMELGGRYTKLLLDAGLSTSQEIANAFVSSLPQEKGIGAGCLTKVKEWLNSHPRAGSSSEGSSSVEPAKNTSTKRLGKSGSK